jgi:transcriptional regulator
MYLPKYHEETNLAVMHELIRAHALGAWVSNGPDGIVANHIPFFVDSDRGEFGTLIAHVARANPVWKFCEDSQHTLIIFQGPECYITPSWYPSKHEQGKAVPTWNYAVVHAYGEAKVIHDPAWILRALHRLTDTHEASQALPWQVDDAPREFIDQLLGAIVGIEIPIQRIIGKWKVHQNRSTSDQLGVMAGLTGRGDNDALAMAALVKQHIATNTGTKNHGD